MPHGTHTPLALGAEAGASLGTSVQNGSKSSVRHGRSRSPPHAALCVFHRQSTIYVQLAIAAVAARNAVALHRCAMRMKARAEAEWGTCGAIHPSMDSYLSVQRYRWRLTNRSLAQIDQAKISLEPCFNRASREARLKAHVLRLAGVMIIHVHRRRSGKSGCRQTPNSNAKARQLPMERRAAAGARGGSARTHAVPSQT